MGHRPAEKSKISRRRRGMSLGISYDIYHVCVGLYIESPHIISSSTSRISLSPACFTSGFPGAHSRQIEWPDRDMHQRLAKEPPR